MYFDLFGFACTAALSHPYTTLALKLFVFGLSIGSFGMKSKFVHMSPDPPSPQPSIQLQLALLDMRKKREEEERQRTLKKLKRVRKKVPNRSSRSPRRRALPGAQPSRGPQQPNPQEADRVIIDPVILQIFDSDGELHFYRTSNKTKVGLMLRRLSKEAYWRALPPQRQHLFLIEAPRPFLRLAPDFQPNRMCVISNRPDKMDD